MVPPPPAIVSGGGGFGAPPPVVAPPPMAAPPAALRSPGALSGPMGGGDPGAPGVLVGFLVTFQNEPTGSSWLIRSGRMQLGRAGADARVDVGINDASASSRHASIVADPTTGQAFIEDDGSRNGTFVNEQRVQQGEQRQLHDNDRLRIGSTTFVIKLLVS
jgi:hypothetical protein